MALLAAAWMAFIMVPLTPARSNIEKKKIEMYVNQKVFSVQCLMLIDITPRQLSRNISEENGPSTLLHVSIASLQL